MYKTQKIDDQDKVGDEFRCLLNDIPKLTSIFSENENFQKLKTIRYYFSDYYANFEKGNNTLKDNEKHPHISSFQSKFNTNMKNDTT